MKPYLVEIKATPNNIQRIQYGNDFASVALMVQNGKLPIHGLRELNEVERHDYQRGGVQVGLQNIFGTVTTWEQIKDKAHLYVTAKLRSTGEYVQLCRVVKFIDGGDRSNKYFGEDDPRQQDDSNRRQDSSGDYYHQC